MADFGQMDHRMIGNTFNNAGNQSRAEQAERTHTAAGDGENPEISRVYGSGCGCGSNDKSDCLYIDENKDQPQCGFLVDWPEFVQKKGDTSIDEINQIYIGENSDDLNIGIDEEHRAGMTALEFLTHGRRRLNFGELIVSVMNVSELNVGAINALLRLNTTNIPIHIGKRINLPHPKMPVRVSEQADNPRGDVIGKY
ncbi:hypothetical protein GGR53DRAFT_465737 [Hypoxylon sp. FL1150]|nr:hypothetical protein GGR53DRAFT_465737 [Hypoxylon sp. FL1150]